MSARPTTVEICPASGKAQHKIVPRSLSPQTSRTIQLQVHVRTRSPMIRVWHEITGSVASQRRLEETHVHTEIHVACD